MRSQRQTSGHTGAGFESSKEEVIKALGPPEKVSSTGAAMFYYDREDEKSKLLITINLYSLVLCFRRKITVDKRVYRLREDILRIPPADRNIELHTIKLKKPES